MLPINTMYKLDILFFSDKSKIDIKLVNKLLNNLDLIFTLKIFK